MTGDPDVIRCHVDGTKAGFRVKRKRVGERKAILMRRYSFLAFARLFYVRIRDYEREL